MSKKSKPNPSKRASTRNGQSALPIVPSADERLDLSALETWLRDAACAIRGATDAPKFKDFILPLIFYKRLSDVFDDEFARHAEEFGDETTAREVVEADHADALTTGRRPIIRFVIPEVYSWDRIRNHPSDGSLGEFITEAMREVAKVNPDLQGVLDVKDYNEKQSGQRTLDEARAADYNLSPSQFVDVNDRVKHRPLADILADLETARAERERADAELAEVLSKLGLGKDV